MLWFIRLQGLSGFQHSHLPDLVALVLPEGERHMKAHIGSDVESGLR